MGGPVLTRAAQLAPALVVHAVYLAAIMPASGVPAAACARMPENAGGLVTPALVADAAIALLTPDAPAGIAAGTTTLTADGWGCVPRSYVICTQDMTIRPALQRRFIADADAAFPGNPCQAG